MKLARAGEIAANPTRYEKDRSAKILDFLPVIVNCSSKRGQNAFFMIVTNAGASCPGIGRKFPPRKLAEPFTARKRCVRRRPSAN